MSQGVEFPIALVRVGRHFNVSWRTIQRAWQARAKLHKEQDKQQVFSRHASRYGLSFVTAVPMIVCGCWRVVRR